MGVTAMKPLLTTSLLMFALAGCAPDAGDPEAALPLQAADSAAVPPPAAPDARALEAYYWRLSSALDGHGQRIDALFVRSEQPVQLQFAEDRISVSNTCNQMAGGYVIAGSRMEIGQLMSTMMACSDDALTRLDREIGARLAGSLAFAVESAGGPPTLRLTGSTGDVLSFTGFPTPETRFGGPGELVFLEVAAQTQPCSHPLIPEHQCLQVREISFDDQGLRTGAAGAFEHFYADIEGYRHEPGVRNVLRVLRFSRDPAPADGSAYAYVLDLVVESEQIQP
jgi:heat shock protein HslJ